MRTSLLVLATCLPLAAQWLNHPDPRTPRTKDGKPRLTAPAPRINGKPDLSGVWQAQRTPPEEFVAAMGADGAAVQIDLYEVTKHSIDVFWGLPPDQQPTRPDAARIFAFNIEHPNDNPNTSCLPNSIPTATMTMAFKMTQSAQEIVVLHESGDPHRQIYLDGRSLPVDPQPSWMGYSTGKWDGDTLVVETVGITSRAWLDLAGHPRSETMRITERYRRRDFGHMDYEVTFNDPTYYTRPFGYKAQMELLPDTDVLEFVCLENLKPVQRAQK